MKKWTDLLSGRRKWVLVGVVALIVAGVVFNSVAGKDLRVWWVLRSVDEDPEETGIDGLEVWSTPVDLDVHVVEPPAEPAHLHLDVRFVVRVPDGAVEQGNHESEELLWVALDELDLVELDASALRLIEHGTAAARRYGS